MAVTNRFTKALTLIGITTAVVAAAFVFTLAFASFPAALFLLAVAVPVLLLASLISLPFTVFSRPTPILTTTPPVVVAPPLVRPPLFSTYFSPAPIHRHPINVGRPAPRIITTPAPSLGHFHTHAHPTRHPVRVEHTPSVGRFHGHDMGRASVGVNHHTMYGAPRARDAHEPAGHHHNHGHRR